jgi:ubiquinone/menaquinone biosynthesis C-methylase UbiE
MVVKEINRVLKPGGYVEFREVDPVVRNTGPRTQRLFQECR